MVEQRRLTDKTRAVFEENTQLLREACHDYLPSTCFDFHAHLYYRDHGSSSLPDHLGNRDSWVGIEHWQASLDEWMGECSPTAGLFFAYPKRGIDIAAANDFVLSEVANSRESKALLLVTPSDERREVESQIVEHPQYVSGFKVYHCYAERPQTQEAEVGEFLPEWCWELADAYKLVIMLHLVKQHALADRGNQAYLLEHSARYPNARLVLAHAGRGFCSDHTVRGVAALRALTNVYFDTSVICEAPAFDAILTEFGPEHLLFGSDFPVSEMLGRAVSVGDRFIWLDETAIQHCSAGDVHPTLVGIESLKALVTAFHRAGLSKHEVELVMQGNARRLLGLDVSSPTATHDLYQHAKQLIPGGTQLLSKRPEMFAPNAWPAYYRQAQGCEVVDLGGRKFLDFSTSGIGACLLGFADPEVNAAVINRVRRGSMCSQNAPEEVELAERLLAIHPWAERARFTRTGGEANAVAIRVARASTGRDLVAFCGYHGWSDWYLATNLPTSEGSQSDRLQQHLLPGLEPSGVPIGLAGTVVPFGYNQLEELRQIVSTKGDRLAAVIMEPFRYTEPEAGFLSGVRTLCDECGAVLIFDEITSGWRFNLGGFHLQAGITPDMAVFAKSMSNGFPMAAIIGTQGVMEAFQQTFISSTYWTEAIGPTAALATITKLEQQQVHQQLAHVGREFRGRLLELADRYELPLRISGRDALQHLSLECEQAAAVGTLFTVEMLKRGVLAGAGFYPTLAHREEHVEQFMQQANDALSQVAEALRQGDVEQRLPGGPRQTGFARLVS
ncbi:aminotransferase class III-fold pyridoxal phosphate-dependent enzyme [Aeoliella mucimassa]|uniref:3-aminobutyryl-CoA aminotransferase n=1 Tax=Aeoliella mucimassa TaxID=2527972 RepID=A0A518AQ70_9BACT|nr:aminotransferase class III-fold pyridoxal phosphate-dependent enzyme [Aeoliella mucimassa]QDU56871.1 3-aminobutyryl-CoA aminotransferase [Aeoliella mucimassa]